MPQLELCIKLGVAGLGVFLAAHLMLCPFIRLQHARNMRHAAGHHQHCVHTCQHVSARHVILSMAALPMCVQPKGHSCVNTNEAGPGQLDRQGNVDCCKAHMQFEHVDDSLPAHQLASIHTVHGHINYPLA